MSDTEKRPKKKGSGSGKAPAKAGASVRDWIIRGVIFGGLAILLVVALLDFQAKSAATGAAQAWRDALKAKDEKQDLRKSEFDRIPVKGSPAVTTARAEQNSYAAVSVTTYVWKGTFRTYTVKVFIGLGEDPAIEHIEGP